ncbi:MAG: hypothetical protein Q9160_002729 [Pyrenula sp. 1 TL-2023]
MATSLSKPSVAILNDYASLLLPKLSHLSAKLDAVAVPGTFDARDPAALASLVQILQPFSIISTMRERTGFPASVLNQLPNLKLLLTTGPGNAAIDLKACAEKGIVVAGTTGRGSEAHSNPADLGKLASFQPTNEHTWALILGLAKRIAAGHQSIMGGEWEVGLSSGLAGKTIGLLGLGKLGGQCARTAVLGFGMNVVAWSEHLTQEKADEKAEQIGLAKGTYRVTSSKKELFQVADVLSVHYVLSDRSRGIVGDEELKAMKKDAMLVNTSRGPLIDDTALLAVLREGRIKGAALDVFDIEPLPNTSPWRTTEWGKNGKSQVLLSPHMGYVEERVMNAWYDETVENIERWLDGKDLNNRFAMPELRR